MGWGGGAEGLGGREDRGMEEWRAGVEDEGWGVRKDGVWELFGLHR